MKANFKVALALAAGAAISAGVIQGVHAQTAPPAYFIADVTAVTDPEALKTIGPKLEQAVSAFGGKILVRGDKITALTGAQPKRVAVIRFDSLEKAQGWWNSDAQKEVRSVIEKVTTQRTFFVEGLPQ